MNTALSAQQWETYKQQGYLKLGKVMPDIELKALSQRIDDIMLGKAELDYKRIMMQREAGEGYEQSEQTKGFKGPSLNYRKIEQLEYDSLFLAYIQHPLFRDICAKVYGTNKRISCFRAMFMNKPAKNGSVLPYHQDRWQDLDRDPQITVWTAIDPATVKNGCVKIFPGTHRQLINPKHPAGFLTGEQEKELMKQEPVKLVLEPGEVVLLHNWTVHGSDGNLSEYARRAFSVCYMETETQSRSGQQFPVIFGDGELSRELL